MKVSEKNLENEMTLPHSFDIFVQINYIKLVFWLTTATPLPRPHCFCALLHLSILYTSYYAQMDKRQRKGKWKTNMMIIYEICPSPSLSARKTTKIHTDRYFAKRRKPSPLFILEFLIRIHYHFCTCIFFSKIFQLFYSMLTRDKLNYLFTNSKRYAKEFNVCKKIPLEIPEKYLKIDTSLTKRLEATFFLKPIDGFKLPLLQN